MLFFEYSFLFAFLPLVCLVYYAMPRRLKNAWLFLASCLFYSFSSLEFLPILLLSIVLDYAFGRQVFKSKSAGPRRFWLFCSIGLNLAILGYFKYVTMVCETLNLIPGLELPVIRTLLPVGISFYTFQSMSYTIDIYRGQAQPAASFLDFGAYVNSFPQLIAGPIVRFTEVDQQLRQREHSFEKASRGIELFCLGLIKKILLADTAAQFCDPIFDGNSAGFLDAWLAIGLYSTQIYFDFSGYSDMAVGLGRLFGFEFPQNFNSPYKAASFSDFWRRWHITLSLWLRDNLYIPLGGNRKGPLRTYGNLGATMLLGGLWHGASWNFVLWGAWHGLLLAVERRLGLAGESAGLRRALRIAAVFLAVTIGWVFFRCDDIAQSLTWFQAMAGLKGLGSTGPWGPVVLGALLLIVFAFRNSWQLDERFAGLRSLAVPLVFIACVLLTQYRASSPFLYFRF